MTRAQHPAHQLAPSPVPAGWGSPKFNQMGRHKGVLMRAALALGVTLLLCDVDTVWLRDPRPLLARYGQVDLLITTDVLAPSRTAARRGAPFASADGGLEAALTDVGHVPHAHLLLMRSNIGVMLLRPTLVSAGRTLWRSPAPTRAPVLIPPAPRRPLWLSPRIPRLSLFPADAPLHRGVRARALGLRQGQLGPGDI